MRMNDLDGKKIGTTAG